MNSTNINAANKRGMKTASSNVRLPEIDGFVHTCEIRILPRPGIDLQRDLTSRKAPRRVTGWRAGGDKRQAVARFNANNETIKSPATGELLRRGNCTDLATFEDILTTWAEQHGFVRDDIRIKRLDFALDNYHDEDAALFRKLCDLMIACFSIHSQVDDYGSFYGETFITMRPKNNKAVSKKRDFAFERYSKHIESPDHGAIWRCELRYSFPRKSTGDPLTALNKIVAELRVLPAFIEVAEDTINESMLRDFRDKQARSANKIHPNQYILQHDSRFFSHRQVRKFIALASGVGETVAESRARDYIGNNEHLFISKEQFKAFIKSIIENIKKYGVQPAFSDGVDGVIQPCYEADCDTRYTNTTKPIERGA